MSYIAILGRQPALGRAELEARFGADKLRIIQPDIIEFESNQDIQVFNQFGSTLKVAKLLTKLDYTDWSKISSYIMDTFPHHIHHIPEGKITLGISVYGLNIPPNQVGATALSLKKTIKKAGRSVRVVPNTKSVLNTAQVLHNKLTSDTGHEMLVIKDGDGVLLAQTQWVQDIETYRRRDQERPARDARVGMLPPKLAQIIINLAKPEPGSVIYDPFCGTGVLLQEALLMGMRIYGSDIDQRMIDYTKKNLAWLSPNHSEAVLDKLLWIADATSAKFPESGDLPKQYIACETYLGRPFSHKPDEETLRKVIQDCNTIHKKFLQNVASQTKPGFRMCIAVPAWKTINGFKHLPTLDQLEDLGYNRVSFVHARTQDLIYHRPDQIVARELVVITRK
jgi:tRNA (guanine10-N2)-dimethyltransferase